MKWKKPRIGDIRIRKGFLLLPKTINGETRWLKWAVWKEEYIGGALSYFWREVEWK